MAAIVKMQKTISSPKGDSLKVSFNYSKPEGDVSNLSIEVFNVERKLYMDITDLFDEKELSAYADSLISDTVKNY